VPVTQLTVEQLGHVRQTTEREIEMLMTKIGELNVAHQKLTASRECATFMGESSTPQPVLVPLTTSIYVPGVIQNPSELMVDVGTGYFISVRVPDGSWFACRLWVAYLCFWLRCAWVVPIYAVLRALVTCCVGAKTDDLVVHTNRLAHCLCCDWWRVHDCLHPACCAEEPRGRGQLLLTPYGHDERAARQGVRGAEPKAPAV